MLVQRARYQLSHGPRPCSFSFHIGFLRVNTSVDPSIYPSSVGEHVGGSQSLGVTGEDAVDTLNAPIPGDPIIHFCLACSQDGATSAGINKAAIPIGMLQKEFFFFNLVWLRYNLYTMAMTFTPSLCRF